MNLNVARGAIENLQTAHTRLSILHGPQMREAAGVSAAIFAFAGMGAAAAQTLVNVDAGADEVDIYQFSLGGFVYAGCTRAASFKTGDYVEVVYETRESGREVVALRRPSTRSIWLYPYMSRGSRAVIVAGLKLWLQWGAATSLVLLLIGPAATAIVGGNGVDVDDVPMLIGMPLALLAIAIGWMIPRFLRFGRAADQVFAALGYDKPEWVDLQKTSRVHRKANRVAWTVDNAADLWY